MIRRLLIVSSAIRTFAVCTAIASGPATTQAPLLAKHTRELSYTAYAWSISVH